MGHLLRWVLPFVLLLHASCKRPVPSRTSGGSIAPATHEGYVDAGGGVQLFYRMVGASSDPVVVLHGGPGFTMDSFAATSSHWLGDTPSFSTTSAAPVGLPLVSDSTALDAQRFAEDLEAIRRHFRFERLTLLGHSWGAGVAALYAARHPDRVGRLLIVGGIPLLRRSCLRSSRGSTPAATALRDAKCRSGGRRASPILVMQRPAAPTTLSGFTRSTASVPRRAAAREPATARMARSSPLIWMLGRRP
jgi:pimeloyl-ACP methyl ester carboxylesterase